MSTSNLLAEGVRHGYQWRVMHNDIGYRCGYMRVPYWHPWFDLSDSELGDIVDCHGCLTYIKKGPPQSRIPKFSYSRWIGFDCAHAGDAMDPELCPPEYLVWCNQRLGIVGDKSVMDILSDHGVIRTQEYVEDQCCSMVDQARLAAHQFKSSRKMAHPSSGASLPLRHSASI